MIRTAGFLFIIAGIGCVMLTVIPPLIQVIQVDSSNGGILGQFVIGGMGTRYVLWFLAAAVIFGGVLVARGRRND